MERNDLFLAARRVPERHVHGLLEAAHQPVQILLHGGEELPARLVVTTAFGEHVERALSVARDVHPEVLGRWRDSVENHAADPAFVASQVGERDPVPYEPP